MAYKGIIRKLDGLGRICIPSEFRKALGINKAGKVEMFMTDNNELILKSCTDKLSVQNINTGRKP